MSRFTQMRNDIEDEIATFMRGLDSRDIAFFVAGMLLTFIFATI
jgi:hypothetical protein